ncbi:hypothetical protein HAZT_HAZT007759, partial [Hyalella azteca]
MMALFPFLTLQARSLGITEAELGIVYAFLPLVALFGPPLAGMIADKLGNFKLFLAVMVFASGLTSLLYMAVPVGRIRLPMPEVLPMSLECEDASDAPHTLHTLDQLRCEYSQVLLQPVQVLLTSCSPRCLVNGVLVIRDKVCANTESVEDLNPQLTFWLYVVVRLLNSVTLESQMPNSFIVIVFFYERLTATSMPLFEGAVVTILKQYDGDFGFQKIYGSLGPLIMTPVSGALIDAFSTDGSQDYRPAFYVYFAVKLICTAIILTMNLEFKKPSERVIKDFKSIITNQEIFCFLVMCFVAGACFGAMDTFLFWLLQDMGASKSLMGLTVTVGNICSLPILLFASPIIESLGAVNTIILGFSFYVVRFIGYSLIYNPWLCMPFEALECFTVALLITAAISYTADLSSPTTTATLQGLMG